MHLFSRQMVLSGSLADAMAHAATMRAYVSEKTGTEFGLWSIGFGGPVGAVAYAARVEGIAGVSAWTAALAGDTEYASMLATGSAFVAAPPVDSLAEVIHGDLGTPPPIGSVAMLTTATIGNGAYAEAIGWGVDMAQHAEKTTGLATSFLMQSFGAFGAVAWLAGAPNTADADAANAALAADGDYIAKLRAAGDLFLPGSGHRSLAIRVA